MRTIALFMLFMYQISLNILVQCRSPKQYDQYDQYEQYESSIESQQPEEWYDPAASAIGPGTRLVGKSCTFNADCITGAFCNQRICKCWAGYIHLDNYCWKKVNPEESGCTYNAQCDAVWPDSKCSSSGVCKCPDDQKVSLTREGPACHAENKCPTNGDNAVLYVRNSNKKAECYYFDRHGQELPGHFMGCEEGSPELYDCIDGFCCPSRAYVCIQPMDPGERPQDNNTKSIKRWFYNSASGVCKKFEYKGTRGNGNNFESKQHCESYCQSRCARGQPLIDEQDSSNQEVKEISFNKLLLQCQSNSDCKNDKYICTKIQSQSICCPSAEYICSEYGGISGHNANLSKRPLQGPFNVGTNRFGGDPVTRWYWDRSARKCRTFRYHGQAGSFNNYLSESDCLEFCSSSLCPVGSPLRVDGGGNAECETDHNCPKLYYCTQTVCCPTAEMVCNLPLALGSACRGELVTKYYYNAQQEICQVFQFNGCGGNANSFNTLESCTSFCKSAEPTCPHGDPIRVDDGNGKYWKCDHTGNTESTTAACPINYECNYNGKQAGCCPKNSYTCGLMPDGKICSSGQQINKWYYDSALKTCKSFDYSGCLGNPNRFDSERECIEYCGVQENCPYGGDVLKNNTTKLAVECGPSTGIKCPQTHNCEKMSGSTANSSSNHGCCPTKYSICSMPTMEGDSEGEPSIRFAFDAENRQCKPFMFKGTNGNPNNFVNSQLCMNFCTAAACSPGEVIYKVKAEDQPFDCSNTTCPSGFICVVDVTNLERSVCCGTLNMGVCPSDQGVFIDEKTQKPLSGDQSDCPIGYFSVYNKQREKFFCCSPNDYKTLRCPNGLDPTKNLKTQELMGCSQDQQCPPGSKCHHSNGEHQSGICCNNGPVCPLPMVLDVEKSKKECNPIKSPNCGSDPQILCVHSDIMERFVCCKRGSRSRNELKECPGKMIRDPGNQGCSLTEMCNPPSICIRRNFDRNGICCLHRRSSHLITLPLECPNGASPHKDISGQIKICNDRVICPQPYKCKLSDTPGSRSRICCMDPPQKIINCPHKLLPLSADGAEQSCKHDRCPNGYKCHAGDACCPNEEFACSVPFFSGVKCGLAPQVQRWYFSSGTGRCQPFIYYGCTPSANNFPDETTCYKLCIESEASNGKRQCSFPYENPDESVIAQECLNEHGDECGEGQRCIKNAYGQLLCCTIREALLNRQSLIDQELKELSTYSLDSFCGPDYIPLLDTVHEEPVGCHPFSNPCPNNNHICQYTKIVKGYICCFKASNNPNALVNAIFHAAGEDFYDLDT